MKIETALILCAGYGKRVKPLTDVTPKPLLKINDLTLLHRCINLIESLDINHILLNTFYLQDEITNYIKNNKDLGYIHNSKVVLSVFVKSLA